MWPIALYLKSRNIISVNYIFVSMECATRKTDNNCRKKGRPKPSSRCFRANMNRWWRWNEFEKTFFDFDIILTLKQFFFPSLHHVFALCLLYYLRKLLWDSLCIKFMIQLTNCIVHTVAISAYTRTQLGVYPKRDTVSLIIPLMPVIMWMQELTHKHLSNLL